MVVYYTTSDRWHYIRGNKFSEWLESMRKDIECAFGILKGLFSILRFGICFGSISKCDEVWLIYFTKHNMLLRIDGINKD